MNRARAMEVAGARGWGRAWRVVLAAVGVLLLGAPPASARVSFTRAWGWGILNGRHRFEICTSATGCKSGIEGERAGQFNGATGVAVDGSGDVFVTEFDNERVDKFSSADKFIKAWGWGVRDTANRFETCTTKCFSGYPGGFAGQVDEPEGVAVDRSGHVFVADYFVDRIDEFSSAGKFIKAWGWGVRDNADQLETCTTKTGCQGGYGFGGRAGQLDGPYGVAVDGSGHVFVADLYNNRVDEFSLSGSQVSFTKAWGWGVVDGAPQFETCTTITGCETGIQGAGAGQFGEPQGVAVDAAGHVFVTDFNDRVDEFSSAGKFITAWGWGVRDHKHRFETCTTTTGCQSGVQGGGAGQFIEPRGVAVDGSGDVFVTEYLNFRVDQFRVK